MSIPVKSRWSVTAVSGDPRLAIDDRYATQWVAEPSPAPWLQIDLGEIAILGGIEVYWGEKAAFLYHFEASLDGVKWVHLCATRHGEGGLNVFAFPPTPARFVRWVDDQPNAEKSLEIVQINLYAPDELFKVPEDGRIAALGHGPVRLPVGGSITMDFGYVRSPLGALIAWGEDYGTVFSVHLSDDGENFREMGRILTSTGDYDSFYWRITTARAFRFTLHEASSPQGAIIRELKLRILNKDRMPIGQLERAAQTGRGELYPQSLLNRQIYWTALGEPGVGEQALFDEYGNLEPRRGGPQITPLLRLGGRLRGAPGADAVSQSLLEGSLPIPTVAWSAENIELRITALVQDGAVQLGCRMTNNGASVQTGALVLALRPMQINPYWQHGGHALIKAVELAGASLKVNDREFAAFPYLPDIVTIVDFDDGDVVNLIDSAPHATAPNLRSESGLLSAACEFNFSLAAGETTMVVLAAPLREGADLSADAGFAATLKANQAAWRRKLGPRRIEVGDAELSETVEAQIGLILVNATRFALKPGPRNYDRTWIRDGSSQALALLYAGLLDEAKTYVAWYAERLYANGMVPPILNPDGTVNLGYGSDIEFDAQGQFVAIAAETYRITRDRGFLETIFEPVVRATRFIDALCARTNAIHGPDTRYYGLLAPSISHEGYNKPVYSYWDDFFALRAYRDCAYLAAEIGAADIALEVAAKGEAFAANLTRSMRMTGESMGTGLMPASADREDFDPTSTSIAFEPCRIDDVLPAEYLKASYDKYQEHLELIRKPDFEGGFTPYEIRNLNAFVSLGRLDDAFQLLADSLRWRRPVGFRHWAEVVWGNPRVAEYVGDMPHTWIGAEFATAIRRMLIRENGTTLELFRAVPDGWWAGEGITLRDLPSHFGTLNLRARREAGRIDVDLDLSGPAPASIRVRCPGAREAWADGVSCPIADEIVVAPSFKHLTIHLSGG